ncbi:MAG: ATP phosphoribosyltransferase regulatory subunit [Lachnospiraceae bacterium]|nr:ATP phosphoribosyltransferase regulatory subunit [Lachnospiraceae bacterium]
MIHMDNELLHTPDGFRDLYGASCAAQSAVQSGMHKVMELYGFEETAPPAFEFFNVFLQGASTVSTREMFRFFDRDGNTLVLRPDFTPGIARCAARYDAAEDLPLRLCYHGNTYVNTENYKGRPKEIPQLGAELINDGSADADAEMIALLIDCLKQAGLTDFRLEIGHAEFLNGLLEEAGLDEARTRRLKDLIAQKNVSGVEALLADLPMDEGIRELLIDLPMIFGDLSEMKRQASRTKNARSVAALQSLTELHEILSSYGISEYLTYDLGLLSAHDYYTGIIFKAYTYGTGDALALGGRYDRLLSGFGKDAPSIGFAILLDPLMSALKSQDVSVPVPKRCLILYRAAGRAAAVEYANRLRAEGILAAVIRRSSRKGADEYLAYAKKHGFSDVICLNEDGEASPLRPGEEGL